MITKVSVKVIGVPIMQVFHRFLFSLQAFEVSAEIDMPMLQVIFYLDVAEYVAVLYTPGQKNEAHTTHVFFQSRVYLTNKF